MWGIKRSLMQMYLKRKARKKKEMAPTSINHILAPRHTLSRNRHKPFVSPIIHTHTHLHYPTFIPPLPTKTTKAKKKKVIERKKKETFREGKENFVPSDSHKSHPTSSSSSLSSIDQSIILQATTRTWHLAPRQSKPRSCVSGANV